MSLVTSPVPTSITLPVPKIAATNYHIQGLGGTAFTTLTGAAGRIDLGPFAPTDSFLCDELSVNVTTLIAAAQGKILVYEADGLGYPTALLHESSALDFGSTGAKTSAVNIAFTKGRMYWAGLWHSSTAIVRGTPIASCMSLGVLANTAAAPTTLLRRTLAFGSAPNPWVYTSTELTGGSLATVFFRVV